MNPLRGKCKELSEKLVQNNEDLELIRGYYICPYWGKEQHWWAKNKITGEIEDPTRTQFPSMGLGDYEEFSGKLECEECGIEKPEEEMQFAGRFPVCSGECYGRLVGVRPKPIDIPDDEFNDFLDKS